MTITTRRDALSIAVGGWLSACTGLRPSPQPNPIELLEQRVGGRIGAMMRDPVSGRTLAWREHERFAHCSSFKLSLAAWVLDGARRGLWLADERLQWTQNMLLSNSPATTSALASGLTLVELARAVVVFSDNTGANVLLHRMGGPEAMTAWWRSIGDNVSRLDRFEPDLNRVPPGSLPDTTTPAAMMLTVEKLVSGDILQPRDRDLLTSWMAESQTGLRRVRAAVLPDWLTGDKTGTSLSPVNVTYVDLAFAGPVGKQPLIMAIWYEPAAAERELSPAAEAVVAECARIFFAGAAE